MSGYIENSALSEQLADREDALLRKPFGSTQLREWVRSHLDQRSTPDAAAAQAER